MGLVTERMKMLPYWLKVLSGGILTVLILKGMFKKTGKEIKGMGKIFKVPDMTCQHCVKTLEKEIGKLDGVKTVRVSLKKKELMDW